MVFIKRHAKLFLALATILIVLIWCIVKRENDYLTHVNRVTKKFVNEMEKQHGFSCFSIGGSLAGNIKEISLKFKCYEKKSIEEARVLEIDCIERFCEMINSNKKIRPHLEEFPFPTDRVGIMICFCREGFNYFPPEESITTVNNARRKFIYKFSFNDQRPNQKVLEESHSEAYEKVKEIVSDPQQPTLQSKYQSHSSKITHPSRQVRKSSVFDDEQQGVLRHELEDLEDKYGFCKKER